MARLNNEYNKKIKKDLMQLDRYESVMALPNLEKLIVNVGVGDATTSNTAIDEVIEILTQITGQKPIVTKSSKAISAFKLREDMDIGVHVTLRGEMMWEFFDKLVNIVFPRTKDFRGLSPDSFDGNGNYSIGIEDHTVFPEIDPNKVQKLRSLQVTLVTNNSTDEDARILLNKFGFPFKKDGKEV